MLRGSPPRAGTSARPQPRVVARSFVLARWVARLDSYYDRDWRPVLFQPILALFVFAVGIRLAIWTAPPPPFAAVLGYDFYEAWLTLAIGCPLAMAAAWAMIRSSGRAGVFGRGLRLAADIGLFTVLLSYHVVSAQTGVLTESRVFVRYVFAAVLVFVLELIVRDLWAIRLLSLRAKGLRS